MQTENNIVSNLQGIVDPAELDQLKKTADHTVVSMCLDNGGIDSPETVFSTTKVSTPVAEPTVQTAFYNKGDLLVMLGADFQFFFHENFDEIVSSDLRWITEQELATRAIVSAIRRGVSKPTNLFNIVNGVLAGVKGPTPIPTGTYALYPVAPEVFS